VTIVDTRSRNHGPKAPNGARRELGHVEIHRRRSLASSGINYLIGSARRLNEAARPAS